MNQRTDSLSRGPILFGLVSIVGVTLVFQGFSPLLLGIIDESRHDLRRIAVGALQLLLLLLPTLLLARAQPLPLRRLFRLREVRPGVYLAMAVGIVSLWPLLQCYLIIQQRYLMPTELADELQRMYRQTQEGLFKFLAADDAGALLLSFLLGALIPGFSEEMLYRGLGQRSFERSMRPASAILLAGALFGAIHFQLMTLIPLIILGCYFGYVTWATESIFPAILGHAMFNAITIVGLSIAGENGPREIVSEAPADILLILLPITLVSLMVLATVIFWLYRYRVLTAPPEMPEMGWPPSDNEYDDT